jgi:predicted nucleic acid-binding protein
MIALDSSTLIEYLSGGEGADVDAAETALEHKQAVLPPVVLSELLSDHRLPAEVAGVLKELPLLSLLDGFWERTGYLRSKLIRQGRKAPLADSLIAQVCIDHGIPLITRDADFRHFARHGGLRLLPK